MSGICPYKNLKLQINQKAALQLSRMMGKALKEKYWYWFGIINAILHLLYKKIMKSIFSSIYTFLFFIIFNCYLFSKIILKFISRGVSSLYLFKDYNGNSRVLQFNFEK